MISTLSEDHLSDVMRLFESLSESQKAWNAHIDQEWLAGELKVANCLGAWRDETLLGILCFRELGDEAEITFLATHGDFQGQGVMKKLFSELNSAVSGEVWLEVHSENAAARRFYEAQGFLSTGVRKNYYSDGADALLYTLKTA